MIKKQQSKRKHKMPEWLIVVLYFGCIAVFFGGLYGAYKLTSKDNTALDENQTKTIVEEADGTQREYVSGKEAFDKDGYSLDDNGERIKSADGTYSNILVEYAKRINIELDSNDFGVDDKGYCYRPSTGERYKTPSGREVTAAEITDGGYIDKNGYVLDGNDDVIEDAEGKPINYYANNAKKLWKAEVNAEDFGVDDEGYCYRPSTGKRYKTPSGKEFKAEDIKNGGFSDEVKKDE